MLTEDAAGSLGEMGERQIFAQLLQPRYRDVPSFGDDCATLRRGLVITTDSCPMPLVASLGVEDPYYTGWLLATINFSDLAAAGAWPEGLVVNYTLRADTPVDVLEHIIDGVDACARFYGTGVLGGDIQDGCEMHLSATAIGRCLPRRLSLQLRMSGGRLSRRGARAGDRLLLVGSPGYLWGAALLHYGWASLSANDTEKVFDRARRPIAQLKAGRLLAHRGIVRAAIDVSDGLYAGVRTLCDTNGLGAVMHADIELDAVLREICDQAKVTSFQLGQTWGDWSLLVAVTADDVRRAVAALTRAGIGVREVGVLTADEAVLVIADEDTKLSPWEGIDQERFSKSSWHGDGIDEYLQRLRG